jgi:hypothetical protein
MKNLRKIASLLLVLLLMLQMNIEMSYAAVTDIQKPPEKLSVAGIGFDQYDKYFADFTFDFPSGFFVPGTNGTFLNVYSQEILKGYKSGNGSRTLREGSIPADAANKTYRMKNLNSGTVYYTDMTAFYKYQNGNTTSSGSESVASNKVKFMTDIEIEAYSIGTNQIKIEWDDVWNTGGRISYRLYVSDSSDFKNAAPKYIESDDIGAGKPVQVDQTTGKLIYTHTVKDSGKVYYVKVVPVINDDELEKYPEESKIIMVSSHILVKTTKMSSTSDGTIWRLDWSPVIVGLSDSDIEIRYEVYKGMVNSSELPGRIQTLNNTSMYVVLAPGEELINYYIIRALVTRNGEDVYPGITIESDQIMVKDQEVGSNPPTPQIVDQLGTEVGGVEGIGTDKANILWKIPKKITGDIDSDTSYDVWLTTDPNLLNDPEKLGDPISWSIKDGANTYSTGSVNFSFDFVKSGINTLGCKLLITGLNQNTTYYFKIQAKKSYLAYVDDVLQLVPYSSEPALQTIITLVDGSINQPVAPPKPPFQIKMHPAGTRVVTDTTAMLQIKNRWWEEHSPATNKWDYIVTENIPGDTGPFTYPIIPTNVNNYRMQQYDEGVTISLYYTKYDENVTYNDADIEGKYHPTVIEGYSTVANDPYEDPLNNFPDHQYKRNVDLPVTGLEPNTTYVVWVKAFRGTTGSEPSDPILLTTDPSETNPIEKPPVPVFNYNHPADVYIDLGWNFNDKYKYYIKYGKTENINSSIGTLNVDLQGQNYYRVTGLEKDTTYYFWIQAEYTNSKGDSAASDWSDPYAVKTLPDIPPDTPLGFGIKTSSDAVTKNSITYEWLPAAGMEYILEISGNPGFTDLKEYKAGAVTEFKVDNLKSNFRYYARLYAYNPANKLRSTPTASVSAKTLRSDDDYDSGQDNESVISGDYVVKDSSVIKGIWHIKITGVNADRFVEHMQNDNVLDYTLDASNPPVKGAQLSILISAKVFSALNKLKENLIIAADGSRFVIRPGVFPNTTVSNTSGTTEYELLITSPGKASATVRNYSFKTGVIGVEITKHAGGNTVSVEKLGKPLQIFMPYTDKSWYSLSKTVPMTSTGEDGKWNSLKVSIAAYDPDTATGSLGFETLYTGSFAVADKGNDYFDDIYGNIYEPSISNIASVHELKSVKGNYFKPDAYIVTGDAVKLMFDVLGYNYSGDYMAVAVKSGIIKYSASKNPSGKASREVVIAMAVRVYELKSSDVAKPSTNRDNDYSDMSSTNPQLLSKVRYAYENGMLPSTWSKLSPGSAITRGETMYIVEKALVLAGDMD